MNQENRELIDKMLARIDVMLARIDVLEQKYAQLDPAQKAKVDVVFRKVAEDLATKIDPPPIDGQTVGT